MNKNDLSFSEYKQQANADDIQKMIKGLKPKWWENIPLLGTTIFYRFRLRIILASIDRGLYSIFVGYLLLFILTPWFPYLISLHALKNAQEINISS